MWGGGMSKSKYNFFPLVLLWLVIVFAGLWIAEDFHLEIFGAVVVFTGTVILSIAGYNRAQIFNISDAQYKGAALMFKWICFAMLCVSLVLGLFTALNFQKAGIKYRELELAKQKYIHSIINQELETIAEESEAGQHGRRYYVKKVGDDKFRGEVYSDYLPSAVDEMSELNRKSKGSIYYVFVGTKY